MLPLCLGLILFGEFSITVCSDFIVLGALESWNHTRKKKRTPLEKPNERHAMKLGMERQVGWGGFEDPPNLLLDVIVPLTPSVLTDYRPVPLSCFLWKATCENHKPCSTQMYARQLS